MTRREGEPMILLRARCSLDHASLDPPSRPRQPDRIRRALELLASCEDGCPEGILRGQGLRRHGWSTLCAPRGCGSRRRIARENNAFFRKRQCESLYRLQISLEFPEHQL